MKKTRTALLLSRSLQIVVLLVATACGPSPEEVEQAELRLADARTEIERLAGYPSPRPPAPPIPDVPRVRLSAEEHLLVDALLQSEPGSWGEDERERVQEILERHGAAISALDSRGSSVTSAELVALAPALLRAARLMTVRDRLHLLDGDEAAFLAGVESRLDLARRLSLQPEIVGPLLGNALYMGVIGDSHRAVTRSDTSDATLRRLDALLESWQLEAPGPSTAFARHMLPLVGSVEPGTQSMDRAAIARDVVAFARDCRERDCFEAIDSLGEALGAMPDEAERYPGIPDLLLPNLLDAMERLVSAEELTRLARTALAVRAQAVEDGAYPEGLEVVQSLGLSASEAARITYAQLPGGGVRLEVTSGRLVAEAASGARRGLHSLLTWELPPG